MPCTATTLRFANVHRSGVDVAVRGCFRAIGRGRPSAVARRPVAPRRRPGERAVLVYQPQINKVGRQPDRLPLRARDQAGRREGRDVRRHLRECTHPGRQGHAHGRVREPQVTKTDFPTLPDHGAAYTPSCRQGSPDLRTISLDRLEASLAIAGIKPPTVAVKNTPPQVIVSYRRRSWCRSTARRC